MQLFSRSVCDAVWPVWWQGILGDEEELAVDLLAELQRQLVEKHRHCWGWRRWWGRMFCWNWGWEIWRSLSEQRSFVADLD